MISVKYNVRTSIEQSNFNLNIEVPYNLIFVLFINLFHLFFRKALEIAFIWGLRVILPGQNYFAWISIYYLSKTCVVFLYLLLVINYHAKSKYL